MYKNCRFIIMLRKSVMKLIFVVSFDSGHNTVIIKRQFLYINML